MAWIVSHPDESFIMKVAKLSTTNSDLLPRFWRHRPKKTHSLEDHVMANLFRHRESNEIQSGPRQNKANCPGWNLFVQANFQRILEQIFHGRV